MKLSHWARSHDPAAPRAPRDRLTAYGEKWGWGVPLYSPFGSEFHYDFTVTIDAAKAPASRAGRAARGRGRMDAERGRAAGNELGTEQAGGAYGIRSVGFQVTEPAAEGTAMRSASTRPR
ncbi:DUF899 family protein [Actinoplanes sp. LDG1-01]|uniref:DUF899 family protein n=1 Tax=Paractinoplanes lichenicola TaxID=2802976 RepID=A0ABS1VRS6_9ACTN|nr:DUF899 family protein [Actinoplanes lichenicola]